jgi:hypothetical protein
MGWCIKLAPDTPFFDVCALNNYGTFWLETAASDSMLEAPLIIMTLAAGQNILWQAN